MPAKKKKKKKKKKRKKRVFPDKELLFPNVLHASPEAAAGHPRDNTASVERANSALGFVKSDHRSTMSEGRLNAQLRLYSTVGCRRTGGRRSQPGSFLFFTTSANLVLILQSVFESRRLACSAQTVCDDACWAGNAAETFQTVEVESFRSPSNAAEEVVFTANALCVW